MFFRELHQRVDPYGRRRRTFGIVSAGVHRNAPLNARANAGRIHNVSACRRSSDRNHSAANVDARSGIKPDWQRVFEEAAALGVAIEMTVIPPARISIT